MICYAALTTAKTSTAIAAIELFGPASFDIASRIFETAKGKKLEPTPTLYHHGRICSNQKILDDVILAVFSKQHLVINCHGNPLIVKNILELLQSQKAQVITAEKMLQLKNQDISPDDIISIEANTNHPFSKTLEGVNLILNQPKTGLKKWTQKTIDSMDNISSVTIRQQALAILQNSSIAKLIIEGARVVLTGPPNSGKSTLLNALAGKSKAIVSDIAGTTRDWVSIKCRLRSFYFEFIDTAGISPELAAGGKIDARSQEIAKELLGQADMVLLVLDGGSDKEIWFEHEALWQNIINDDTPVLTVLNKSDLGKGETGGLWISALNNSGIDAVVERILANLGLPDFDLTQPVCFTKRQLELIKLLTREKSNEMSKILLEKLLYSKE